MIRKEDEKEDIDSCPWTCIFHHGAAREKLRDLSLRRQVLLHIDVFSGTQISERLACSA
jgi:hypothetical protein